MYVVRLALLVAVLVCTHPWPVAAQAAVGDIVFWLPFDPAVTPKQAQVMRNARYVSIKLHAVYAYYKSGFFENIKQLLVKSDIAFELQGKKFEGTMLNTTHERPNKSGEFIGGINDHLAVLSPATPTSVTIGVGFRGVGEDRFKKVFDVLSGSALKVPLNLTDATLGQVNGITSVIRGFFATPYTSNNPRQILDVSQSFVIYADDASHEDALREGYLVIVSAREGRGADLTKMLGLSRSDIRLSSEGQALEYRDSGVWKLVADNSYVILSVTQAPIRGEDESAWLTKYSAAAEAARKAIGGGDATKAREEAMGLWREGNILLAADRNYIESERGKIRNAHLSEVDEILKGAVGLGVTPALKPGEAPGDFTTIASDYQKEVAKSVSTLAVHVTDAKGKPLANTAVLLSPVSVTAPKIQAVTDQQGLVQWNDVKIGEYLLMVGDEGTGAATALTKRIGVDARPENVSSWRLES